MEKIDKAVLALFKNIPLLGGIVKQTELIATEQVPVAGTDGVRIFYNPTAVQKLSLGQVVKVLAHEAIHILSCHFIRAKPKEVEAFNICADLIVNSYCDELSLPIVEGEVREGVMCPVCKKILISMDKDKNKSVEELYNTLINHPCFKNSSSQSGEGGEEEQKSKRWKRSDGKSMEGFDEHKYSNTEKEARKKVEEIIENAWNIAKSRGDIPGSLQKLYEQFKKTRINWKEMLTRFIESIASISDYSWRRYNKISYGTNVPLPIEEKENEVKLVIAIDTSGSISDEEYITFISEVRSLLNVFPMMEGIIVMHDVEITNIINIENIEEVIEKLKRRKGFGGTSHNCVFEFIEKMEEKPEAIILFTDGETELDKKFFNIQIPSLWVYTAKEPPVEGGMHVLIKYGDNI